MLTPGEKSAVIKEVEKARFAEQVKKAIVLAETNKQNIETMLAELVK